MASRVASTTNRSMHHFHVEVGSWAFLMFDIVDISPWFPHWNLCIHHCLLCDVSIFIFSCSINRFLFCLYVSCYHNNLVLNSN